MKAKAGFALSWPSSPLSNAAKTRLAHVGKGKHIPSITY